MKENLPVILGFAAAFSLTCHGCADARDGAGLGVTYDTIAGVEHVLNAGPGAWNEPGEGWRLDEAGGVVIGDTDGPDEFVFGTISGVLVDPQGMIHVSDPQAMEIRTFSRGGEFLRRVGREGEGPGEFKYINGLALGPGGIGALDGGLGRVTVFDSTGDVARTFRLQRAYIILSNYAPMAFDSQGRFFDRGTLSRRPGVDSVGVIRYGGEGTGPDTAFLADIPQDHVLLERNGMPFMSIPRPFAPQPSITFGPQGAAYLTRGGEYRIDVFSPEGDSLRAVFRTVEAIPVTEAERDSALAFIAERFGEEGGNLPPGTELPARKAVVVRLVVDSEENLWVRTEFGSGPDHFEWSVHDSRGRYLGRVVTPVMVVTQIGADFLAGVTRDDLGVPRAVVYPLRKGPP